MWAVDIIAIGGTFDIEAIGRTVGISAIGGTVDIEAIGGTVGTSAIGGTVDTCVVDINGVMPSKQWVDGDANVIVFFGFPVGVSC